LKYKYRLLFNVIFIVILPIFDVTLNDPDSEYPVILVILVW